MSGRHMVAWAITVMTVVANMALSSVACEKTLEILINSHPQEGVLCFPVAVHAITSGWLYMVDIGCYTTKQLERILKLGTVVAWLVDHSPTGPLAVGSSHFCHCIGWRVPPIYHFWYMGVCAWVWIFSGFPPVVIRHTLNKLQSPKRQRLSVLESVNH